MICGNTPESRVGLRSRFVTVRLAFEDSDGVEPVVQGGRKLESVFEQGTRA